MNTADKIALILDWAEKRNGKFSTAFVESVQSFLATRGFVTSAQESALDNIIAKWKIE